AFSLRLWRTDLVDGNTADHSDHQRFCQPKNVSLSLGIDQLGEQPGGKPWRHSDIDQKCREAAVSILSTAPFCSRSPPLSRSRRLRQILSSGPEVQSTDSISHNYLQEFWLLQASRPLPATRQWRTGRR